MARKDTWTPEELDQLKDDVIELCQSHALWYDSGIYVNGNRYRTGDYDNEEIVVEEGLDPTDYLEYVNSNGNIFSMYFEGPLYHALNGYTSGYDDFLEKFEKLFTDNGLYYEFGNAWNFTCYPLP